MAENDMEKWAKIQARCAIGALLLAGLGLPPTYYCAYSVYSAKSSGVQQVTTPAHFDIAFILLVVFYAGALVAGIGWLVLWTKRTRSRAIPPDREHVQVHIITPPQERKLIIYDATYGAIDGGGVDYPVEPFLTQIGGPNGLAFEIQNRLFKVNGLDYVPEDPRDFHKKRLKITYSFNGGPKRTIRRREGTLLVLPEDPSIEGFPLIRLDVIEGWNKLQKFLSSQVERIKKESPNEKVADATLFYDASPDLYLTAAYVRSLKSEMIELHQSLVIHRLKDLEFEQLVHNSECRKDIQKMMEFLWKWAPHFKEEDDEKDRIPGRQGSPRKI